MAYYNAVVLRTLLRVSHVVWSNHTLTRADVKFDNKGMLLAIRQSVKVVKLNTYLCFMHKRRKSVLCIGLRNF